MRPTARRFYDQSLTIRSRANRRGGFTLVEMMVSVTLVMLMMLMFAEIFGLAQETISTQKGIATNDQKARILAEVLRTDLENRTFVSVYPFKLENPATLPLVNPEILSLRKGYFSYSENDPNSKIDDTLQFTVQSNQSRVFGKAFSPIPSLVNGDIDGPAFDDGRPGGASTSRWAEVSYYLRDGNLYRSVLLIRDPYLKGDTRIIPPLLTGSQGKDTPDGFPGSPGHGVYTSGSFWGDFDSSVYRETQPAPGGLQFHGSDSLSNNPNDTAVPDPPPMPATDYLPVSDGQLWIPRTLGAPQLRFGHSVTGHGQPFEFSGTYQLTMAAVDAAGDGNGVAGPADWAAWRAANPTVFFFGRFNSQERSDPDMTFPGQDFGPFTAATLLPLGDYRDNTGRRGVDLMLPNVQGFDVQVWDDIEQDFVNLGHTRPANNTNPYTGVGPQFGFYHISRLRTSLKTAAGNYITDAPSVPADFGNRYDTWCPNMSITDGTNIWRNGRAPYRPFKANPDPNVAPFNATTEPAVAMGDMTLDDDADGSIYPTDTADTDAEAPLRAIRITVHYLDPHSGQTRQATIEQSLVAPTGN